jgi:SAM-dependent methyltransferase
VTAPVRVSPEWLRLREPADAAARSTELVERIRQSLPARPVIHDLGCGTGSMGRWLAPRLNRPQHWILYDRDADLLGHAAADPPGDDVTVETRERDISRLDPGDLAGAALITASALLDIMTAEELDRFVASCITAGCPVLITITVVGSVELTPADPLDDRIGEAFNAHQRRIVGGRRLLGPDAVDAAVGAFTRHGADVLVRPSPWRLDATESALAAEWLTGWVDAACEQQPGIAASAASYARRRLAEAAAGGLDVTVQHQDLLAVPW